MEDMEDLEDPQKVEIQNRYFDIFPVSKYLFSSFALVAYFLQIFQIFQIFQILIRFLQPNMLSPNRHDIIT